MRRLVMIMACLAGPLALVGCSHDNNLVRDGFEAMGYAANVPQAPDFVVNSRKPGQDEYIPVGIRQPERKYKAKTPDQIKAAEGQLDAVRAKTEAQGAAVTREGAASSK